ncbi:hypothetical protein HK102_013874, partial [Quaeritorhiza haematococci]
PAEGRPTSLHDTIISQRDEAFSKFAKHMSRLRRDVLQKQIDEDRVAEDGWMQSWNEHVAVVRELTAEK